MQKPIALRPLIAHWVMFAAALLQFAGAVMGPLTHRHLFAPSAASTIQTGDPVDGEGSPAHGELACLVCQAITAVAVVPAGGSLPLIGAGSILSPTNPTLLPASLHPASARARAPPLA